MILQFQKERAICTITIWVVEMHFRLTRQTVGWVGGRLVRLTMAGVVYLSLAVVGTAHSRPVFEFVKELQLNAGNAVIRPEAVTWDQFSGELCVTDTRGRTLILLNDKDIEIFRTTETPHISFPGAGSLDQNGGFFYVEQGAKAGTGVKRLNLFGEPVDFVPELPQGTWQPDHLLVVRNGDLITLDSQSGVMVRHDSNTGALIWEISMGVAENDALNLGRPAEGPDGRIFVPGGALHQIIVFSADGILLESFGELGSNPGKFTFPVGAAFDPQGNLLVLDRMRHKVMAFDPDHKFLSEFGSMGAGLGNFYHPLALAASDEGLIYVAQGFRGRVQVFSLTDSQ